MDVPERRAILHVDMDAFFPSVEALEDPSLRGRALIVGGDGPRGVVASCSYEARYYGVRSAMPSARARRLCPHATFVHGDYERYAAYSERMHAVFRRFSPLVEGIALDEAFLDVTGARRLFGAPAEIGRTIRSTLLEELGLSASVGVATSKHLAKLASERAKPRATAQGPVPGPGVFEVTDEEALEFLHALPVRALWGVGPKAAERLAAFGVDSVGRLAHLPLDRLERAVGVAHARHLHALAWNQDDRPVVPHRQVKSIGHEQTYPSDLYDREEIHHQLVRLADAVAGRLRATGCVGRTITVKVRFGSFRNVSRSRTVAVPTSNAARILDVADDLVSEIDLKEGVRLLGISVAVSSAPGGDQAERGEGAEHFEQLSLDIVDGVGGGADQALDSAIDAIRARFGDGAVVPAPLVGPAGQGRMQRGEGQWGPSVAKDPSPPSSVDP